MKTVLIIFLLTTSNLAFNQWKVSTYETQFRIGKEAHCYSSNQSENAKSSKCVLHNVIGTYDFNIQILYETINKTILESRSQELIFMFFNASNDLIHTYHSFADVSKHGKGYSLICGSDRKLVKYFKKYAYTIVTIPNNTDEEVLYKFSLKGFSKACREMLKF